MNKEEWIAVGVKLFGIFLVVMAIYRIPESLVTIYNYVTMHDLCSSSSGVKRNIETSAEFYEAFCQALPAGFIKGVSSIVVYTICGLYFIKSGKLAQRILGS